MNNPTPSWPARRGGHDDHSARARKIRGRDIFARDCSPEVRLTSRRRVHVGGVGAGIGPASHRKRPACSASSPAPPMLPVRGSRLCKTAAAHCGLVVRPTSRCCRRCACHRRHAIAPPRGRTRASLLTYLGWAPPRYPPRQGARSILGWRDIGVERRGAEVLPSRAGEKSRARRSFENARRPRGVGPCSTLGEQRRASRAPPSSAMRGCTARSEARAARSEKKADATQAGPPVRKRFLPGRYK